MFEFYMLMLAGVAIGYFVAKAFETYAAAHNVRLTGPLSLYLMAAVTVATIALGLVAL